MSEAPQQGRQDAAAEPAAYGTDCSVTDYILGITFEIWEEGRVDKILQYYSEDCPVLGLDGITRGAAQMVELTHATLGAFPDRLLIGDDVIWDGSVSRGYSSHRVLSPMTNLGATAFGPATGRSVRVMNIADCEVVDGQITREWLVRDNLALVTQLGFDPMNAARTMADGFEPGLTDWLTREFNRVTEGAADRTTSGSSHGRAEGAEFARKVLTDCWISGNARRLQSVYAPYCVLHRAPVRIHSGRTELLNHYSTWRRVLPNARISIDQVCSQPFGEDGRHIAVRWGVAGNQQATFCGCAANGQPLFILGVTHWRVLAGRIISEWTVFDELALMAQSLSGNG
jgi:predicted ester cyclase